MACVLLDGVLEWEGEIDDDGYRTYPVTWQVQADVTDGPANVMQTPGLPVPGTMWSYDADVDVWAWCRPGMKVKRHRGDGTQDPTVLWEVTQTFSTKRPTREQGSKQKPPNERVDDPLSEPAKISGGSVNYQEEQAYDRYGARIETSAREPIRGPQVEFDAGRTQIVIEQNLLNLQYDLVTAMLHTVNDAPMWGMPARFIKLSDWKFSRQYYGQVYRYFVRTLTFDIFPKYYALTPGDESTLFELGSGFDRRIPDEGTICLRGQWERDENLETYGNWIRGRDRVGGELTLSSAQPSDFVAFQDFHGNPSNVLLDGHGWPWDKNLATTGTDDDSQGIIPVEYYGESNFALLGIPPVLV